MAADPQNVPHTVAAFAEDHGVRRVLVGVSGGVDSVVLLHALCEAGLDVRALHVHHGLRGAAADADEQLVHDLCTRWHVPLGVHHADPEDWHAPGASLQAAARTMRYRVLAEAAEHHGCPHVAVAHHRDDQAETVLLRLLRGSGPEGLAGMAPVRRLAEGVRLVRPLLDLPRETLRAYAEAHALPWREDASNRDPSYRRAALRHEVLPVLHDHVGEDVAAQIAHSAKLMRAYVDTSWQRDLAARWQRCARDRRLALGVLREQPRVWQGRLVLRALRRWLPKAPARRTTADAILDLLGAQPGRRVALHGGTVWREREALRFVADDASELPASGTLGLGETLRLRHGTLTLDALPAVPSDLHTPPATVLLDHGRLALPLAVRPWQDGDRIAPLGMGGRTKLVSDVLSEARVPPSQRAERLVVLSESRVIWVVGVRLAHEVRIRSHTERSARLTFRSPTLF